MNLRKLLPDSFFYCKLIFHTALQTPQETPHDINRNNNA